MSRPLLEVTEIGPKKKVEQQKKFVEALPPPISPFLFSSLQPAEQKVTPLPPLTKPQLDPPRSSPHLRQLHAFLKIEQVVNTIQESQQKEIDGYFLKLEQIKREQMIKMEEMAKKVQSGGFWKLLRDIASLIIAVVSTMLGISAIASGASVILGGILIFTGILNVGNFIMQEAGIWQWLAEHLSDDPAKQKKLAALLPAVVGVVSIVAGLFGAIGGFIVHDASLYRNAALIGQSALTLFTGGTTFATSLNKTKIHKLEAALTALDGNFTQQTLGLERSMQAMKLLQQEQVTISKDLLDVIRRFAEEVHHINQTV